MATKSLPSPELADSLTTRNARAFVAAASAPASPAQPQAGPWQRYGEQAAETEETPGGPWQRYSGSAPEPAPDSTGMSLLKGARHFVEGIGAGALTGVYQGGDLIRRVTGQERIIDKPEVQRLTAAPEGLAGSAGKFAEQAGEFAIPAGWVSRVTKGMPLLMRMAAQGLTAGGVSALQTGGDPLPTAAATVTGAAGPAISQALTFTKFPQRMYQSALKPTWAMARKEGAELVNTGLREEIPVSGKGLEKIDGMIDSIRNEITRGIQAHAGRTVDTSRVLQRLDGLEDFYRNTAAPQDALDTLQALRTEFEQFHGQQIPLDKAQQIKINTYQALKKSYGEMKSSKVEGLKAVARGLKEEISSVFPEIAGLNERQSKLLGMDEALYRAVWRIENHQLMGIGSPLAATAGHALMGSPGAAAGFAGKLLLDSPELKSKLAIALARSGVKAAPAVVNSRLAALKGAMQRAAAGMTAEGSPAVTVAGTEGPTPPKVAKLAHVRAYMQQKGISEADAIREFRQAGWSIGQ